MAEEAMNWLSAIKESAEVPEPEKDENYCKFYCKYYDATGEMGCVGLKKERIQKAEVVIDNPDADKNALMYLQLDEEIKKLSATKESLRASLEGFAGTTNSGVQIIWTSLAAPKRVDAEEVEKLLGFVPYKQGQETARISVKLTGGK
jgi:hypothetical protein